MLQESRGSGMFWLWSKRRMGGGERVRRWESKRKGRDGAWRSVSLVDENTNVEICTLNAPLSLFNYCFQTVLDSLKLKLLSFSFHISLPFPRLHSSSRNSSKSNHDSLKTSHSQDSSTLSHHSSRPFSAASASVQREASSPRILLLGHTPHGIPRKLRSSSKMRLMY